MTTQERVQKHAQSALEFLEHSDREFEAGDVAQGSEKLWGAASQAVMAVAIGRGWRFGKSGHRGVAVDRLAEELGEPQLKAGYGLAETFHANFYHDFMEDGFVSRSRPLVQDFVLRVVEVARESQ